MKFKEQKNAETRLKEILNQKQRNLENANKNRYDNQNDDNAIT